MVERHDDSDDGNRDEHKHRDAQKDICPMTEDFTRKSRVVDGAKSRCHNRQPDRKPMHRPASKKEVALLALLSPEEATDQKNTGKI
jgi:hypothetical protein